VLSILLPPRRCVTTWLRAEAKNSFGAYIGFRSFGVDESGTVYEIHFPGAMPSNMSRSELDDEMKKTKGDMELNEKLKDMCTEAPTGSF
jgi:hypothetical protein